MKLRTKTEADVNITSMIDCLMMIIIFFMAILSAQYTYGVAIKFPSGGKAQQAAKKETQEKYINVYIQADLIDEGHALRHPGILKLNGEEIQLVTTPSPTTGDVKEWLAVFKAWNGEQEKAYLGLRAKMADLVKQGYKTDMLMIQGEMKTYHEKTLKVIDLGKDIDIQGFSLVPPTK